jgi:chemotaxis protein histidine kinase CheA
MRVQRFMQVLAIALAVAWVAPLAWIALDRLGVVASSSVAVPMWALFAGGAAAAVVVSGLIAAWTGPTRLDAAMAIDHAFTLNERVSTALELPEDLRESPAGHALLADAARQLERLDLTSRIGLERPRLAWLPIVPAVLALAVSLAPRWAGRSAEANDRPAAPEARREIARRASEISKSLAQTRKELDAAASAPTDQLLAEIEKALDAMAKAPPVSKDKALMEINKLTDALKERQKQLGSAEQVGKQLQMLKDLAAAGPADELAKNLARADFDKAADQLKSLREKMTSGQLSDEDRQKLDQQLGEMKDKLKQLANMEERKKQLDEARKNGAISEEQHKEQTARLEQQARQLQQLSKLADKLGAAQAAMQQGDMNKAASALGMSEQQLKEMAQQLADLETLDQALADIQDGKAGMAGDGMNQLGEGFAGMNGLGGREGMPGSGLGRGRGQGDRPEAPDDVAYHSTTTKSQLTKGKAIVTGIGPPRGVTKGQSQIEISGDLEEAAGTTAAEAMSNQRVPNSVRKHVLGYFDQVRKGGD